MSWKDLGLLVSKYVAADYNQIYSDSSYFILNVSKSYIIMHAYETCAGDLTFFYCIIRRLSYIGSFNSSVISNHLPQNSQNALSFLIYRIKNAQFTSRYIDGLDGSRSLIDLNKLHEK